MVTVETKHSELNKYVGKKIDLENLKEILFNLGFDLEHAEGDELKVDISAERSDLISTQGLARALRSYLGLKVQDYKIEKSGNKVIVKNMIGEWPYAVAAIVKGLKFDDEKIKEVIRIQEKLGATFLRHRKKGGLGLYPLEKIKFPITFTCLDPKKIKYRPLEYPDIITGEEVLERHPTGIEYRHICENWKRLPVFIDSSNTIMSMPPIVNSHDMGKITENTTDVFVEATGLDLKTINIALQVLVGALIDMGGKAYSIDIVYDNKKVVSPDFTEEKRTIKINDVNKVLGTDFNSKEVGKLLEKMGYKVNSSNESFLKINVPGTRSDIWHDVDVIDDIARAYGFNNFELRMKPVSSIGGTRPSVVIKEELTKLMIGLGYQEVFTLILSNKQDQFENMNIQEFNHIDLGGSAEKTLNMVRVWLIPELMKCLMHNRSLEYPQKIFEVSEVVIPDDSKDVKSRNVLRLACISCHTNANYTEIKQILDHLMNSLGLKYKIREEEHFSFIPGRVGRVSVDGKDIAYIGEIHPKVISNFGLELPIVALEINLTDLFGLDY
ncbi:phenylalanine--tRNA ligase subunit beta [Candidatus Woesearchaeota archaeon]|nr:phenylalanine--tRNA ligase subunit beta [Candidatus Woesearchaeota archaeon]